LKSGQTSLIFHVSPTDTAQNANAPCGKHHPVICDNHAIPRPVITPKTKEIITATKNVPQRCAPEFT
ncbi:hypothetical protein ACFLB9_004792, partial [Salmonella enterica]